MNHRQHGAMPGTDTSIRTATTTPYKHHEGKTIWFSPDGHFAITEPRDNGEESCTALPVGDNDLIELGLLMVALGFNAEALAARRSVGCTGCIGGGATNRTAKAKNDVDNLCKDRQDGAVANYLYCWGQVKHLPDLDAAAAFLRQIGGNHGV